MGVFLWDGLLIAFDTFVSKVRGRAFELADFESSEL
jgi:hypothetical protein